MEKYEKPSMEVIDIQNDIIVTRGCGGGVAVDNCNFGYCSGYVPCDSDDV